MLKNVVEINKYKDRDITKGRHEEYQYLNLLKDIMNEGHDEVGRNGNTRCVYGAAMHFSLENNIIPNLTTKKTAWKTCLKELLWFISGSTDTKILPTKKFIFGMEIQHQNFWNQEDYRIIHQVGKLDHFTRTSGGIGMLNMKLIPIQIILVKE